ncbi:MAG: PEP-CTERM sorting domain-containing protein, partial [Candidatus Caldarchaeum sp.]
TTRPGYAVDYRAVSGTGFQVPTGAFTSFTIARLNVVPEPASLLAVSTGLAFLALRRRRR